MVIPPLKACISFFLPHDYYIYTLHVGIPHVSYDNSTSNQEDLVDARPSLCLLKPPPHSQSPAGTFCPSAFSAVGQPCLCGLLMTFPYQLDFTGLHFKGIPSHPPNQTLNVIRW